MIEKSGSLDAYVVCVCVCACACTCVHVAGKGTQVLVSQSVGSQGNWLLMVSSVVSVL